MNEEDKKGRVTRAQRRKYSRSIEAKNDFRPTATRTSKNLNWHWKHKKKIFLTIYSINFFPVWKIIPQTSIRWPNDRFDINFPLEKIYIGPRSTHLGIYPGTWAWIWACLAGLTCKLKSASEHFVWMGRDFPTPHPPPSPRIFLYRSPTSSLPSTTLPLAVKNFTPDSFEFLSNYVYL